MESQMPTTRGLYESVTASIVQQLEQGVRPWTKAWKEGKTVRTPGNAATGRPYSGMNILLLWFEALEKGYASHGWMTFKQANDLGARVRKGEKSCTVVYTSFKPRDVDDGQGGTTSKMMPMLKAYSVFNLAQLENLPAAYTVEPEKLPEDVKLQAVRDLVARSGIKVRYGAPKPLYSPSQDRVEMPNFSNFRSTDDFVSTLGHELIHATGHEDRLARVFTPRIFKDAYATEELVAELGSAFICAALGYSYEEAQSPAYIESWLKVLKQDSRAIFSIASYASQAADWLRDGPKEAASNPEMAEAIFH
jgi:antirestriction protein ArdC